jgi:hypothetical protein
MKPTKPSPESLRASKAAGRRLACLTAYDFPAARLLDDCGLDLLLVGDSLGMVVLGHPDTTQVTMADMVHHTRPVARGGKNPGRLGPPGGQLFHAAGGTRKFQAPARSRGGPCENRRRPRGSSDGP